MDDEIQLIRDGDGLAVVGNQATVERFLVSEGLSSKDLEPRRFRSALGNAAGASQAGSDIAAGSGRWVKLTKESARRVDKYGLRESSTTGLSTGVLKGDNGQIKGFVEFAKGAGPLRANPAVLANVTARNAAGHGRDHRLSRHDRREGRRRAPRSGGRRVGEDGRSRVRDRGGHDYPEAGGSGLRDHVVEGAEHLRDDRDDPGVLRRLDAIAEKMERKAEIGELATAAEEAELKARQ
ncbi:hypothetical protein [Streptomyces canus]|uniref:hypothetical protein n=1 Tax=Streptomyces canus TaxID=58343 RepID=UPI002E306180|nr:hypothetical protein [Streptomyces canus]